MQRLDYESAGVIHGRPRWRIESPTDAVAAGVLLDVTPGFLGYVVLLLAIIRSVSLSDFANFAAIADLSGVMLGSVSIALCLRHFLGSRLPRVTFAALIVVVAFIVHGQNIARTLPQSTPTQRIQLALQTINGLLLLSIYLMCLSPPPRADFRRVLAVRRVVCGLAAFFLVGMGVAAFFSGLATLSELAPKAMIIPFGVQAAAFLGTIQLALCVWSTRANTPVPDVALIGWLTLVVLIDLLGSASHTLERIHAGAEFYDWASTIIEFFSRFGGILAALVFTRPWLAENSVAEQPLQKVVATTGSATS